MSRMSMNVKRMQNCTPISLMQSNCQRDFLRSYTAVRAQLSLKWIVIYCLCVIYSGIGNILAWVRHGVHYYAVSLS